MDSTRGKAPIDMRSFDIDSLARSLNGRVTRRRAMGMLAATLGTSVLGVGAGVEAATARRGKKRNKRHGQRSNTAESRRGTSIPPNCIYVCCDGTCDSWKMCLKCVTWPKPTTTGMLA
jgi:hypothetical protein